MALNKKVASLLEKKNPYKKYKIMIPDIFNFDDQLTEEELLIQKTTRDYCQSTLMPKILEANRNETFDKSIYKELGELGLFGIPCLLAIPGLLAIPLLLGLPGLFGKPALL